MDGSHLRTLYIPVQGKFLKMNVGMSKHKGQRMPNAGRDEGANTGCDLCQNTERNDGANTGTAT